MPRTPPKGLRPPGAGDLAMSPEVQARYRAVRQLMLEILPESSPGMTMEEVSAALTARVPPGLFPDGPGFYSAAVKAHLHSIGLVRLEEGSRPQRFLRCRQTDLA